MSSSLLQRKRQKFLAVGLSLMLLLSWLAVLPSAAEAAAPWYNPNWTYRKEIKVDGSKVQGTVNDFPVLVSITDADIGSKAQGDGDDILVTESDGTTKVSHEIEKFSGNDLVLWLKAPSLSNGVDTIFYIYYGNGAAANQQDENGVWDSNYKAVYHFDDETSATIDDSTANNNDGTKNAANQPVEATGRIGEGQDFDGTGADYINAAVGALSSPFTVEAWGYFDLNRAAPPNDYLLMLGAPPNPMISFTRRAGDNFFYSWSEGAYKVGPALPGQQWVHIVGVYKTSPPYHNLYINGAPVVVQDFSAVMNVSGAFIGGRYGPGSSHYLDGKVDEVRISSAGRSTDWIQTEYNNQSSPGTFYLSISYEQEQLPATGANTPILLVAAIAFVWSGVWVLRLRNRWDRKPLA